MKLGKNSRKTCKYFQILVQIRKYRRVMPNLQNKRFASLERYLFKLNLVLRKEQICRDVKLQNAKNEIVNVQICQDPKGLSGLKAHKVKYTQKTSKSLSTSNKSFRVTGVEKGPLIFDSSRASLNSTHSSNCFKCKIIEILTIRKSIKTRCSAPFANILV